MNKTVKFLQLAMTEKATMRMTRARVSAKLNKVMANPIFDADDLLAAWHSRGASTMMTSPRARLSTLAVSAQLDGFGKVKAAMEDMVKELKTEQQEEVEFKAYCEAEFDKNEKSTYEKTSLKEDLEGKMDQLTKLIKTLEEEIAVLKKQVAETEISIKKASEAREAENAEYQTTVADQRATQAILAKALKKLESFYKKAAAALLQQTPPVQFNSYKKNAGAGPVMGMIEQIVEDSKKLETEAVAGDHESAVTELENLANVKQDLHSECDFVLDNFEIRQKARLQEMEAIAEAKQILNGAA